MTVVEEIIEKTKKRVEKARRERPVESLKSRFQRRSFIDSIKGRKKLSLISEIKPSSPSKGRIRKDVQAGRIAAEMEKAGASALSVLTEPFYFSGSTENLTSAREAVSIPILRKDFIVDEYQIFESAALGADAVLLIAGILKESGFNRFYDLAVSENLEVLAEVHNAEEIDIVKRSEIIGINNRNLKTLDVDTNTTLEILDRIPENKVIVSESGFSTRADVERVEGKVDAILVGTSIMSSQNIGARINELMGR